MTDNSTLIIVIGILIIHFLAGVLFLLYKIFGSKSKDKNTDH
ncbi:hypothetical protein [Algoriphagus sp. CAU 1675]|nr:hypothetical protein [Algoriphagus sp. CAU 1675]MDF2158589.1 hypothetical protein [Algoriphagus sp. CAU 1675]